MQDLAISKITYVNEQCEITFEEFTKYYEENQIFINYNLVDQTTEKTRYFTAIQLHNVKQNPKQQACVNEVIKNGQTLRYYTQHTQLLHNSYINACLKEISQETFFENLLDNECYVQVAGNTYKYFRNTVVPNEPERISYSLAIKNNNEKGIESVDNKQGTAFQISGKDPNGNDMYATTVFSYIGGEYLGTTCQMFGVKVMTDGSCRKVGFYDEYSLLPNEDMTESVYNDVLDTQWRKMCALAGTTAQYFYIEE